MQVGEFHESASRDPNVRREAAVTELRQLADRLSAAPGNAIPPAASLADSVRISPEAREVMNSLARGGAGGSASPTEVMAALRAVLTAPTPQATSAAVARLAELVQNLVRSFPARATGALRGLPADERAAGLVRALVLLPVGHQPRPGEALAAMVRSLFAPGVAAAATEASLQRAALAIFLAAARAALPEISGTSSPLAHGSAHHHPGELPPALHGHLVQPPARRARRDREAPRDGRETQDEGTQHPEGETSHLPGGGAHG